MVNKSHEAGKYDMSNLLTKRIATEIRFFICDNCFWCASYLNPRLLAECPSCGGKTIENMPVSSNERYTFDYNQQDGVVLGFMPLSTQTA